MTKLTTISLLKNNGIEVIIFSIIAISIGYFINSHDPLLISYQFNVIILYLAIVTLFYGFKMGVLMWAIFASFLLYTDSENPILQSFLLENLFFVALFGLFFYHYQKSINYSNIQNSYLKRRLKEFNDSFFTLKISHDKLESTYISQPTSLRYVLADLLDNQRDYSLEHTSNDLLKMLEKNFMVKKSMLWQVENGKLSNLLASNGEVNKSIDIHDALLKETMEHKQSMYLKDLKDKQQTKYIFIVPYVNEKEEISSILIIEDIPFLFYREDVIIKVNVIFNYVWAELEKRTLIEKAFKNKHTNEEQEIIDFKIEVMRLQKVQKKFDINSRVYALKTNNPYVHASISEYFYQNNTLNLLDQYISIQCNGNYIHFITLPFTLANTMQILNKDLTEMENKIKNELNISLGDKSYQAIQSKSIDIAYFNELWKEYGCVE